MAYRNIEKRRRYQAEWARQKRAAQAKAEEPSDATARRLSRRSSVFDLHMAGWSHRKIAETLQISTGTVSADLRAESQRRRERGDFDFAEDAQCPKCGHRDRSVFFQLPPQARVRRALTWPPAPRKRGPLPAL